MHLVNIKIRVKKYPEGWVVERASFNKWLHVISVSGIKEQPWYFKTKEVAIEEFKKLSEWDLIENTTSN